MRQEAKHIPGADDMSLEFYITMWNSIKEELLQIYNVMILQRSISSEQK
jgi:hypothetical protein